MKKGCLSDSPIFSFSDVLKHCRSLALGPRRRDRGLYVFLFWRAEPQACRAIRSLFTVQPIV